MTDAELAKIQARCDRATPGPWTSYIEGRDQESGSSFIMTAGDDINPLYMPVDDQDFAAHARQDVPRLLDQVRRLSTGGAAADADGGVDEAELAQMQRRCDEASPGPWHASLKGMTRFGPDSVVETGAGTSFELRGVTEDDHAFIAHARHDLPRLIAEVHRLRRLSPD